MFKEKILAQLATKFPGVSKKFLSIWAAKLEAKVTEESAIEGVVNELDNLPIPIPDLALEFQKEGDRRVAEAKKTAPTPDPKPGDPKPQPEPAPTPAPGDPKPNGDEPPTWAKEIMKELSVLKGEKVKSTIQAEAAKQLKDVPASYWSEWTLPENEEGLPGFVQKVTEKYNTFKQETAAAGFGAAAPPAGSSGSTKTATPDKIKSIVDSI